MLVNPVKVENAGVFFRRTSVNGKRERFWALKDISVDVPDGQILGVIGHNGAGKSTLLKMLTGVLPPDEGIVKTDGNVTALLSLGAGFLPDLSARDNIYLSAMYMGMKRKFIDKIFDEIVAFSELESFIEDRVRNYSSGMRTRLGFSLAAHLNPDILIIDEVLAAGDKAFQVKARSKMKELMGKARAIVIVSHNTGYLESMCDEVMWLNNGRMHSKGDSADVVSDYNDHMNRLAKEKAL